MDNRMATKVTLTAQQERMLRNAGILQDGRYGVHGAVELKVGIRLPDAIRALGELLRRHEVLRIRYDAGELVYHDADVANLVEGFDGDDLDDTGLAALMDRTRRHAMDKIASESAEHPLWRASVIRCSSDYYLLSVTMHALIGDGKTLSLMLEDWSHTIFGTEAEGRDKPSFEQVSQLMKALQQSESADDGAAFWAGVLDRAGEKSLADWHLPFDKKGSDKGSFEPRRLTRLLAADLPALVLKRAEQWKVAPDAVALAGWQCALWRLNPEEGLTVGIALDGRSLEPLQRTAGPFSRHVPVVSRAADEITFRRLAVENNLEWREIADWQEYFDNERITGSGAIFPFCFEFREETHSIMGRYACWEPFRLKLDVAGHTGGWTADLYYDASYYSDEDADRMLSYFVRLLEQGVSNPDAAIGSLDMLTEAERVLLLTEWNDTEAELDETGLHQWFEQAAAKYADRTAVRCQGNGLTYRELNSHANRLARYLRAKGVAEEHKVAVCMDRSAEMLVALLAVMKAGAAYVPLDTAYPQDRLEETAADAGCAVVLTLQRHVPIVPSCCTSPVILDGIDRVRIEAEPESNLDLPFDADQLAYVIYTSGSTGKPKGVMIEHRGLVNYAHWCLEAYGFDSESGNGALVHTSLGFDLTVTGLFPPLLIGQTVVMVPESGPEGLIRHVGEPSGIGLVKLTPAHMDMLRHAVLTERLAGWARSLIIGGEQLYGESLDFWQDQMPGVRIINEYGPTETVVGCCVYELEQGERPRGAVPIGKPIRNTQLYILNGFGQPMPVGCVGELYIGGAGVARGYLNREELTQERFVPDPFSGKPGARMYRTGDLARYRSDGVIEYVGRTDEQVKVNGFRIELGEIETALLALPQVDQAVAVHLPGIGTGSGRIVAFASISSNGRTDGDVIRSELAKVLPVYMVPSAVAVIGSFPLTPNGKIDRVRLIALYADAFASRKPYAEPRNAVDMNVVSIMKELLGAERVGIHDNFYSLGGDSIRGFQLIARLRGFYEIDVPFAWLFNHATAAEISDKIDELMTEKLLAEIDAMDDETAERLLKEAASNDV